MKTNGRIRIGQIGIGHEHAAAKLRALRRLPDVFELVGVVDDSASPAARFVSGGREAYDGVNWMTEEELLACPGLRAVMVEGPNDDLVPAALRCMERNLAIHMDKPAGRDLVDYKRLLDGCRERGLPFQMGYMFRNNPAFQFCLEAVRRKWLGEIFEVRANMSHDYGGAAYQEYLGKFPGGIMFNLGCHLIDFVVAALGRPGQVTPFLKPAPGFPSSIRNNTLAVLEYPHAVATVQACSLEADGLSHRRMKVCGTRGTIEWSPLERFDGRPLPVRMTLLDDNDDHPAGTHTVDPGAAQDRYEAQLLELARIIRGEMKNPYSYDHDYLVQEVVLAASGHTKWKN